MDIYRTGLDVILKEDIGEKDITSEMLFDKETARGVIIVKENCLLAGLVEAVDLFLLRSLSVFPKCSDGDVLKPGTQVLEVEGHAVDILSVERTALNMLSKMSGIATRTRVLTDMVKKINPECNVSATRKTTPGFRYYEKKAVVIGGGNPHRFGLFDAVLIKDNHLALGAKASNAARRFTPAEAVARAKRFVEAHAPGMIVEVEADTLEQLAEVLPAGPDIVLLDNMDPDELAEAVARRDALAPAVELEASGGVDLETVGAIARSGVERISVGALTHSATSLDLGLDWLG